MKISNLKNLTIALNEKQEKIEVHGNISELVIGCGLVSNVIFIGIVTLFVGIIGNIVFDIAYLISGIYWIQAVAIIFLCVIIFAVTILLTLKIRFKNKLNIALAIKLRKYTVNKKSGKVLLIKK